MLNFVLISIRYFELGRWGYAEANLLASLVDGVEIALTLVEDHGDGHIVELGDHIGDVDAGVHLGGGVQATVGHSVVVALAIGLALSVLRRLEHRPLDVGEHLVDVLFENVAGVLIIVVGDINPLVVIIELLLVSLQLLVSLVDESLDAVVG